MIQKTILCAILLIGLPSLVAAAADAVDYQANFKTPAGKANWSGWAEQPQTIEFNAQEAPGGRGSVEFKVADGWNTAFINFPAPVRMTDRSLLRLYYKGTDTLTLNITNATEQVDYTMQASGVKEGDWYRAELIIADAVYKKGVTSAIVDGLEGDAVSRIQFATLSNKWSLAGLEIIRLENPPIKKTMLGYAYTPRPLPKLDATFPLGVVVAQNRYHDYGQMLHFDQQWKMNAALADIKRHHLNAYANFCPSMDTDYKQAEKLGLHVIETQFSNSKIATLSEASRARLKTCAQSPSLLAWYGADEPSDYKGYLENKLAFDAIDPEHAYASAFTDLFAVKRLGAAMELVMLDAYDFRPGPVGDLGSFQYHGNLIRLAKQYCAGGRVWFITQTFSTPWSNGFWRYPDPVEIRFDVYNSIAAGVNGILFFMYNSDMSYLNKTPGGESIEFSLADMFGNSNPTFDEVSDLGAALNPIMPLLAGSHAIKKTEYGLAIRPLSQITYGLLENKEGQFIVLVNKNLKASTKVAIETTDLGDRRIYNLAAPQNQPEATRADLELPPGGGAIVMISEPAVGRAALNQIAQRRYTQTRDVIELDLGDFKQAGLKIDFARDQLNHAESLSKQGQIQDAQDQLVKVRATLRALEHSDASYVAAKSRMDNLQRELGRINAHIIRWPTRPSRANAAWDGQMERFATLSTAFFEVQQQWTQGKRSDTARLDDLIGKAATLRAEVEQISAPPK